MVASCLVRSIGLVRISRSCLGVIAAAKFSNCKKKMASTQQEKHEEEETGTEWVRKNIHGQEVDVHARQHSRGVVDVGVRATCAVDPEVAFNLLTHPENHCIFTNQRKALTRVIEEDRGHEKLVRLVQAADWRFLMFHGQFVVKMRVRQNARRGCVDFWLLEPGFMKRMEGKWQISPLNNPASQRKAGRGCSEVMLQQHLEMGVPIPPGMGYLVRKVCAHVSTQVFLDFFRETENIVAGRPTIPEFVSAMTTRPRHLQARESSRIISGHVHAARQHLVALFRKYTHSLLDPFRAKNKKGRMN